MKKSSSPVDVHPGVYPPGEDTYILQDAIEVAPQDVVLDMGCGSGYISLNLIDAVKRIVSLDLQYNAVVNTYENLKRHQAFHKVSVMQSDLFDAISPSFKFSIVAFNPPYLPADDERTSMDPALVGGELGIEVSKRFIDQVGNHLAFEGRVYLVASSLADVGLLKESMESVGLETDIAAEESLFFERLVVLRGILQRK